MSERVMNFMKKRAIGAKDVTSIHAQDGRVILNCTDGRQIQAFIPVKEFKKVLEPYGFISVNRGVLVNRDEIRHIERKAYHMKDGTVIEGRVRFLAEHSRCVTNCAPEKHTARSSWKENMNSIRCWTAWKMPLRCLRSFRLSRPEMCASSS